MRERPILFSASMVRAILAGQKTQTRRVVKPQPPAECSIHYMLGNESWLPDAERSPLRHHWEAWGGPLFDCRPEGHLCGSHTVRCPYGAPGDRLWVRETVACGACAPSRPSEWSPSFWRREQGTPANPNGLWYAADGLAPERPITERAKWTPAIHIPRWASRIALEIVSVRVERLHAISDDDARAEGVEPPATERDDHDWKICPQCGGTGLHGALGANLGVMEVDCVDCDTHAKRFRHLWTAINGADSWAENPFVWRVEFKRVKA